MGQDTDHAASTRGTTVLTPPASKAVQQIRWMRRNFAQLRLLTCLSSETQSACSFTFKPLCTTFVLHIQQQWRRPWREGKSCRLVRWEKADMKSASRRSAPPWQRKSISTGAKRQLRVEIPCLAAHNSQVTGYTTKVRWRTEMCWMFFSMGPSRRAPELRRSRGMPLPRAASPTGVSKS